MLPDQLLERLVDESCRQIEARLRTIDASGGQTADTIAPGHARRLLAKDEFSHIRSAVLAALAPDPSALDPLALDAAIVIALAAASRSNRALWHGRPAVAVPRLVDEIRSLMKTCLPSDAAPDRALEFTAAYLHGWGNRAVKWANHKWDGVPESARDVLDAEIFLSVDAVVLWMAAGTGSQNAPVRQPRVAGANLLLADLQELHTSARDRFLEKDRVGCRCWRALLAKSVRGQALGKLIDAEEVRGNLVRKLATCLLHHRLSSWDPSPRVAVVLQGKARAKKLQEEGIVEDLAAPDNSSYLPVFIQKAIKGFAGGNNPKQGKQYSSIPSGLLAGILCDRKNPLIIGEQVAYWTCRSCQESSYLPTCSREECLAKGPAESENRKWNPSKDKVHTMGPAMLILPKAGSFKQVRVWQCRGTVRTQGGGDQAECGNLYPDEKAACPVCSAEHGKTTQEHKPKTVWVYAPLGAEPGLLGIQGSLPSSKTSLPTSPSRDTKIAAALSDVAKGLVEKSAPDWVVGDLWKSHLALGMICRDCGTAPVVDCLPLLTAKEPDLALFKAVLPQPQVEELDDPQFEKQGNFRRPDIAYEAAIAGWDDDVEEDFQAWKEKWRRIVLDCMMDAFRKHDLKVDAYLAPLPTSAGTT